MAKLTFQTSSWQVKYALAQEIHIVSPDCLLGKDIVISHSHAKICVHKGLASEYGSYQPHIELSCTHLVCVQSPEVHCLIRLTCIFKVMIQPLSK